MRASERYVPASSVTQPRSVQYPTCLLYTSFRGHDPEWKGLWDVLFFVGSLLPALLLGVAVGNVVGGLPLDANGDYLGSFFDLLNPFALACGVLGLVHMLMQGASWIACKAPVDDELRVKAARLRRVLCVVDLVVFALVSVLFFTVVVPNSAVGIGATPVAGVFALVYIVSTVATLALAPGEPARDKFAPLLAGVGAFGLVGTMAATLFPYLVPATDPAMSVTVANAAANETSLMAMTVIACIGVPLVLVYHVVIYRVYRGRVAVEDLSY